MYLKQKNLDILNDKFQTRIALLKGQIIHYPESTQTQLDELKEKIENIKNIQKRQRKK